MKQLKSYKLMITAIICVAVGILFYSPTTIEGAEKVQHDGCYSVRLSGNDRYETCAQIALEAFPKGAEEIIVTTGENFPDALAASSYSGAHHSPILLSRRAGLPEAIKRLLSENWNRRARKAVIIGGGFSEAVSRSLQECGVETIEVIAGLDRYETAEKICRKELQERSCSDTCVIATGQKAADALSVSPWTYRDRMPILLARNGTLSDETKKLVRQFSHIYIVGAESCCRTEEVSSLGIDPIRLAGSNRYETSYLISAHFADRYSSSVVSLASGVNGHFPDAVCGAVLSGAMNSPILLTKDDRANQAVYRFIRERQTDSQKTGAVYTFGGEAAVSEITEQTAIGLYASSPFWVMTNYADRSGLQGMFYTIFNEKTETLIVVDGGWEQNESQVRQVISDYGGQVDFWILTHFHSDHVNSFNRIVADPQGITIGRVLISPFDFDLYMSVARSWDSPESFRAFLNGTPESLIVKVRRGDRYESDGLALTFFNTYDELLLSAGQGDIPNNGSLVFKVSGSEDSVLFCGDCCSDKVGNMMIDMYGDALKAKYVQAGHHGNNSFSTAFYDFVSPSTMLFDAPEWLMTGSAYKAKDLKAYCLNSGIKAVDLSSAPNEFLIR